MNDLTPSGAAIQTTMLDAVCEAISAALLIYDRDDHLIFASRRFLSFFPLSDRDIAPGTRLKHLLGAMYDCRKAENGATRETERDEWIAEQFATHWKERAEGVIQRPGEKWLRFTKRRFPSGVGICVITDISEQKKREDQWRSDIERVQITEEILDNLPFSVFVKDRNRVYAAVNKAGCSLLETSPDLVLGRTVFDIHSNPLATRIDELDRRVLDTGVTAILPERITRLNGEEVLTITRKQRVGKPGRYFLLTTLEDVTAFASVDSDGKFFIPGLQHLAFVSSCYLDDEHHQASLVVKNKNILIVTDNVKAGERARAKLCDVGVDCVVVSSLREQRAFMEMALDLKVRVDLAIIDVQMELACLDVQQDYDVAVITVDDFQMESALVNLVTRHFRAHAQSQSGLCVEDDWTIATNAHPVAAKIKAGLDVLVVEDNKINQIVFSQILEGLGLEYKIASSGQEALQMSASYSPSLILLDTTLPDIDGFEVARLIRQAENGSSSRTPIIGVVALAFEGDKKACLEAGMDEMLLKPVSPDVVETLLNRFTPRDSRCLQG